MPAVRSDLDGRIIPSNEGIGAAIVFHGHSHVIENMSVHRSLFGRDELRFSGEKVDVAEGAPLHDGTCLARTEDGGIFLITGLPQTRRHLIKNFESFLEFGFSETEVISIPWLIFQAIAVGHEISSARSR